MVFLFLARSSLVFGGEAAELQPEFTLFLRNHLVHRLQQFFCLPVPGIFHIL
jgi:hypothetical protein